MEQQVVSASAKFQLDRIERNRCAEAVLPPLNGLDHDGVGGVEAQSSSETAATGNGVSTPLRSCEVSREAHRIQRATDGAELSSAYVAQVARNLGGEAGSLAGSAVEVESAAERLDAIGKADEP